MESHLQELPALTHSEFGSLKIAIVLAIFENGHPTAHDILAFVERHRVFGVRDDDVNLRAVRYALLLLQRDSYIQRHVLAEDDVYTIDPRWRQRIEALYRCVQSKLAPKRPSQPEITVEDALRQQAVSVVVDATHIVRQRMPDEEEPANEPDLMTQTIYIPKPPTAEVPSAPVVANGQAAHCIII